MDIRTPDSYKTEALIQNMDNTHSSQEFSCHESDISCRELELAMLQSMEEAWAKEAECAALWASFQPVLERLKRIGYYDKEVRRIHELLSVHLYKHAYHVDDTMSEETLQWIEQHLKTVRLSIAEHELLSKALTQLRIIHLHS
jgi:hypothetical protein